MPIPLFRKIDCLSIPVPDLDAALAFYSQDLGHEVIWRSTKAAGLRLPDSTAELVLHADDRKIRRLLENAYRAFNARDIDAALATMHADVEWPNGMEGGSVHGHSGVRDYWTRQWGMIDPHVEPMRIEAHAAGRAVVDVHQVVRDRAGHVVKDEMVQHVYLVEVGLIRSMEIRRVSASRS